MTNGHVVHAPHWIGPDEHQAQLAPSAGIISAAVLLSSGRLIELVNGLYSITVGPAEERDEVGNIETPTTYIAGVAIDGGAVANVIGNGSTGAGWVGPDGGTLVVNVLAPAGGVMITTYRSQAQSLSPLEIKISRLDQPAPEFADEIGQDWPAPISQVADTSPQMLPVEVVLHAASRGDAAFEGDDWMGWRDTGEAIEALSIRAAYGLSDEDIEYKAFGPDGLETPWVAGNRLCGTRGCNLPLVGFAVRVVGQASAQYDAIYEGAFAGAGVVGPFFNGTPCKVDGADIPLEAVHIRLVESRV